MNHLVVVPLSIVSHTRSTLNLALKLLNTHRSLVITWYSTTYGLPCLERELARHPPVDSTRWRLVEMKDNLPRSQDSYADAEVVEREFPTAFAQMMDDTTWPTPCLVIADLFRPVASVIKQSAANSKYGVPVLAFMPTMAFTAFRFLSEAEDGGILQYIEVRYQSFRKQGMTHPDAATKAWRHAENSLLRIPGMDPIYDYELTPQMGSRPEPPSPSALASAYTMSRQVDGMLWLDTPELDRDILEELSCKVGRPMLGVG